MNDLIEQLLKHTRLRTKIFYRAQHCDQWRFPPLEKQQAVFHLVLQGQCAFKLKGDDSLHSLQEGDLLFIARSVEHQMQSIDYQVGKTESSQSFSFANGLRPDAFSILCGAFEFDQTVRNPLLDALPNSVIVRADYHPDRNWIKHLVALLVAESSHNSLASTTLVEHFSEVFFIHILRSYLSSSPQQTGILAAYNDPSLSVVLKSIHQEPGRPWSIEDFTKMVNQSRTTFIERFTQTLGESPITYLMHLRMELGHRLLLESHKKIVDIALECGYESEATFCRAFKRAYGITPGKFRKE